LRGKNRKAGNWKGKVVGKRWDLGEGMLGTKSGFLKTRNAVIEGDKKK